MKPFQILAWFIIIFSILGCKPNTEDKARHVMSNEANKTPR